MEYQQLSERGPAGEAVVVTIEVHRHGKPVENVKVECDMEPSQKHLAEKLASMLALGTEELVEEFAAEADSYHPARHEGKLKLECIDVHFESEAAPHHFPARAKWKHVFQWACKHFKIAHAASANLEMREGSPDGPAINEAKQIGRFEGCKTVWLVKPGPERNG